MSGEAHYVAVGFATERWDLITVHAGDTYVLLSHTEAKLLAERILSLVDMMNPQKGQAS